MKGFRSTLAKPFNFRTRGSALAALFAMQAFAGAEQPPRPDLADAAAGIYSGDVISDSRGAMHAQVDITVVKVGPDSVRVTSSYARLPAFEVALTRAMNTIQQASGNTVFLLDLAKRPNGLHVTIDDVSWAGARKTLDLADIAAGEYFGEVISDARGESKAHVTITVTKVGPNQIEISSDYNRLPTFRTRLTRAMNTIQKSGTGNEVFLLDRSKSPVRLDITVDDASWSGEKRSGLPR